MAAAPGPVTGTPLDFFTNYGMYMPRTHCLMTEAGTPDWPWIIALIVLTGGVIAGYARVFIFWRKSYLDVEEQDRNKKLMHLAYIFLWCAVCGYGLSILIFFWPAYRLLALCLIVLNFFTWRFVSSLGDFKVSLHAKQYQRQLDEELHNRAVLLEQQVAERTEELERKRDELEERNRMLARSDQRFNAMVANMPGMVYQFVRHTDGSIVWPFVSDACRHLFGLEPEQCQAQPMLLMDRIHEDDRAELDASIDRSAESLTPWQWHGRVRHADGDYRWVQGNARPQALDNGAIRWDGILMNVTEAHATEADLEEVRAESKKLALVASRTDNAVVITDAQGKIEWVNESFERITGFTLDEVVGAKPGRILQGPDTDRDTVQRIREKVMAGLPAHEQILNYAKDNRPYWLDIEIQPVRGDDGQIQHFMAIERDITEERQRSAELAKAKQEAESASQAKSDFLANMSHEIRTPLNAVIGFSDMLERQPDVDPAQRSEWVHTISSSSKHLLSLINDILDISKIEAGKMEFETIPASPHEIVGDVLSTLRVPASERGLTLDLDYLCHLPQEIQTDPTRLRQVLMNLVSNAIKFTEVGGIRVRLGLEESDRSDDAQLVLHVTDTGVGMTEAQTRKVFQSFSQADSSTTRRFGGTGLGLAISKHICESLGGSLTVKSEPGVGSTFTARVPTGPIQGVPRLSRSSSEAATIKLSDQRHEAFDCDRQPLSGRVLLVDDGPTNRKLISLILQRAGAQVIEAEHGQAALDMVHATGPFNLILMDMQMPVLDGYRATRQLRDRGDTTTVIALTAHALASDRQKCLDAGCDDYLAKPIDADLLLKTVAPFLNGDQAMQPTPAPVESPTEASTAAAQNGGDAHSPLEFLDPLPCELPIDDPDFREIAEIFIESARDKLDEVQQAIADDDKESFATLIHWVKGSGGTAGFTPFTRVAREIEAAQSQTALQDLAGRVAELKKLLQRAELGLKAADS